MRPLLLLLALQAAPAPAPRQTESVELSGERWRELAAGAEAVDGVESLAAWASARDVELEYIPGGARGAPPGLKVRARWTIRALAPKPFLGALIGPGAEIESVRWNGRPATIATTRFGTVVVGEVTGGSATIELAAFVPGDPTRAALPLELLPAVTGSLRMRPSRQVTPGAEAETEVTLTPELLVGASRVAPVRVGARFWAGDERVELRLVAGREPADGSEGADAVEKTLAVASVGLGVTVGDAALRGRARVRWELRRGQLDAVSLAVANLGADLELTGAGVRSWRRVGDRVEVELQSPVQGRVELELRWTEAIPAGTESTLPLPRIEPEGAFRTISAAQLARDGEVEVLPTLDGWDALASAELPSWAQGLVEGVPTAAFRVVGVGDGRLDLLRFEPVAAPPAVVDVASYTIATTREGRTLTRAHYELRNERAAFLRIEPPPGARIIGARVAGETALPARGAGDAWLIPLQRSVETVEGLISFPVEVALLGESTAWRRRERRELALPTVDAEVAITRVTVYLPPDYDSRLDVGDDDVVSSFTKGDGITYGLGLGGVGAAEADARFQSAVRHWLNNDFDQAQQELDALEEMGAKSENIDRLQSNLYVIQGQSEGKDKSLERRVKEQAKARAVDQQRALEDQRRQAEEYRRAGEYDKAEVTYRSAIEIGKKLERLEQRESVEQKKANVALSDELVTLEKERARKRTFGRSGGATKKKKKGKSVLDTKFKNESPDETSGVDEASTPAAQPAQPETGAVPETVTIERDELEGLLNPDKASVRTPEPAPAPEPEPAPDAAEGRFTVDGANINGPTDNAPARVPDTDAVYVELEDAPTGGHAKAPARDADGNVIYKVKDKPRDTTKPDTTSRDFTAVIDVAPTASRDAAGVAVGGEAEPAPLEEEEEQPLAAAAEPPPPADAPRLLSRAPGVSARRARVGSRRGPRRGQSVGRPDSSRRERKGRGPGPAGGKASKQTKPPPSPPPDADADGVLDLEDAPAEGEAFADEDGAPDPAATLEKLPAPKTTASALSLVIPAAGEAVLYQRQLLKPNETYTIQLDARERRRARSRHNRRTR